MFGGELGFGVGLGFLCFGLGFYGGTHAYLFFLIRVRWFMFILDLNWYLFLCIKIRRTKGIFFFFGFYFGFSLGKSRSIHHLQPWKLPLWFAEQLVIVVVVVVVVVVFFPSSSFKFCLISLVWSNLWSLI